MKITTEYNIYKCRDCTKSTNTSQMHDCSFTSAPHQTIWYCASSKLNEYMYLEDENKIHEDCPEKTNVCEACGVDSVNVKYHDIFKDGNGNFLCDYCNGGCENWNE